MNTEPRYSPLRDNDEPSIDINDVSKYNPKTTASRDYWDQFLNDFNDDVMSELIIHNIASDDHPRDAALFGVEDIRVDELESLCDEYDIYIHDDEFDLRDHHFNALGTFPNYRFHGPTDLIKDYEPESVLKVIGKTESLTQEFLNVLQKDTEEAYTRTAEIKGVPDCCIAHQLEHQQSDDNDRLYETSCSDQSSERVDSETIETIRVNNPSALLNVMWRFRGLSFIQYAPCSFTCEKSQEIAQSNYETLHDMGYGKQADGLLSWLDLPTTWDAYHGIARVRNAYGIGTYTSDDYWLKSKVYFRDKHINTPELENMHHTDPFKKIEPDLPSLPEEED